ncbi:MAG: hypothetical protein ACPGSD_01040 [Flavobacteriales bacterium]
MDTLFTKGNKIESITFYKLFEDDIIERKRSFSQEKGSFTDVFFDEDQNEAYSLEYRNNKAWKGQSKMFTETMFYKAGIVEYSELRDRKDNLIQRRYYVPENQKYKGERYEKSFRDQVIVSKIENVLGSETFVIEYKNEAPFSGIAIEDKELVHFKNGIKEGSYKKYEFDLENSSFETNNLIEEGYYVQGKKQGIISFYDEEGSVFTCEYKNGKPFKGKNAEGNYTSEYKNGLKDGTETYFLGEEDDSLYFTQEYLSGKLNGTCKGRYYKKYFYGKVVEFYFEGIYKDNKKFSGSFFDENNEVLQHYADGKKEGLFITKDDFFINTETFRKGDLLEFRRQLKRDSLIHFSCSYKNGLPFFGKELTSYNDEIITDFSRGDRFFKERSYKNGKKVGEEKWLLLKGKILIPLATLSIQNEKYHGLAKFNIDKTPSNRIKFGEISGEFKDGKPFSGQFIEFIKPKAKKRFYQNSLDTRVNTYEKGVLISSKLYQPNKSKLIDLIID